MENNFVPTAPINSRQPHGNYTDAGWCWKLGSRDKQIVQNYRKEGYDNRVPPGGRIGTNGGASETSSTLDGEDGRHAK